MLQLLNVSQLLQLIYACWSQQNDPCADKPYFTIKQNILKNILKKHFITIFVFFEKCV